ncbi:MAG: hypothetical protein ACJAR1_001328 [Rubritalea sp.]|jgi:hypothetical protein
MIKAQVQVPDELYKKAKEIAKAKEWSLAEVFRRGLEYMARTHQPDSGKEWKLPVIDCDDELVSTMSGDELNAIIAEEREDYVLSKLGLSE